MQTRGGICTLNSSSTQRLWPHRRLRSAAQAVAGNERMIFEKRGNGAAKLPGAVAMHDPDRMLIRHCRFVEKFLETSDRLVDGLADDVQFGKRPLARLEINVDVHSGDCGRSPNRLQVASASRACVCRACPLPPLCHGFLRPFLPVRVLPRRRANQVRLGPRPRASRRGRRSPVLPFLRRSDQRSARQPLAPPSVLPLFLRYSRGAERAFSARRSPCRSRGAPPEADRRLRIETPSECVLAFSNRFLTPA